MEVSGASLEREEEEEVEEEPETDDAAVALVEAAAAVCPDAPAGVTKPLIAVLSNRLSLLLRLEPELVRSPEFEPSLVAAVGDAGAGSAVGDSTGESGSAAEEAV
jgi:hypothetical protein